MKNFKILFVWPSHLGGVIPCNIAVLSACLKKDGFKVKLFDASLYKITQENQEEIREKLNQVERTNINKYFSFSKENIFEDFVKSVKEYQPNLIAITFLDETLPLGFSLLDKIKELNIPVVAGGITTIFSPERILQNECIDIVCIGEGEEALVKLCNKMYNGEDYSDVENFHFKNKDGTVKRNLLMPLVNLDEIPYPDYSIFNPTRFFRPFHGEVVRMGRIDTDRGCPYGCVFCAAPSLREYYKENNCGQYFRTKKIDRIINEIKALVRTYNFDVIWFSSETFLARSQEELTEFAKRYVQEINLPFWCQTRLDTFTEEKTKLLKEMGCKAVSLGLEHGDDKIRNSLMNKNVSDKQIIESFKLIAKYGIIATVNSMIGLPDETREQVFKTIEMNRKIYSILSGKCSLNAFIFCPFSRTPLREKCIQKGYLKDLSQTPSFYLGSTLDMPSMSKQEILGLERVITLYIKLPRSYFPQIEIAEKDTEEGRKMFEKLCKIAFPEN